VRLRIELKKALRQNRMGEMKITAIEHAIMKKSDGRGRKPGTLMKHKRICKKCGDDKVEYFRKKGGRFFICRRCETVRLLALSYSRMGEQEIYEKVERSLASMNHVLEAACIAIEKKKGRA